MRPEPLPTAPGRMPRRGTDRIEDVAAWFVTAFGLIVILLAGVLAFSAHGQEVERTRIAMASLTSVEAVLLEDAPVAPGDYGAVARMRVEARWTGIDGAPRSGPILALSGARAGSASTVWLDRDGTVTEPPGDAASAMLIAVAVAIGVLVSGAVVLTTAWVVVTAMTGARNSRRWEREWARVAPDWNRHLR